MNNIFLTVPGLGSSYLMGEILSKYSDGTCIPYNDFNTIKNLKSKNIILVKKYIGSNIYSPELIEYLRKRNNKIIFIVIDGFSVNVSEFTKKIKLYSTLYDLVLFNTEFSLKQFNNIVNSNILRHLWDPNLKYNTCNNFNLCYFGSLRNDKIFLHNNINIKEIDCSKKDKKAFYRELLNYNCHYSVRGEDWSEYKYGVNTKLSSAAATNSNIVCSKDNAFIELLPQYDYYVDNNKVETIIDMINRCETEFGSKKWNDNLLKLKKIKEETDPRVIGKQLLSFLN
jgi:hypothetical protein